MKINNRLYIYCSTVLLLRSSRVEAHAHVVMQLMSLVHVVLYSSTTYHSGAIEHVSTHHAGRCPPASSSCAWVFQSRKLLVVVV